MTSIGDALVWGARVLAQEDAQRGRLDAQVVLGHVLGVERAVLYAYPEREITQEQERQFRMLIARRERGEPMAYLVGHKEFYGSDFLVDRRVLIPRPETELLVEAALKWLGQRLDAGKTPLVADIGTGSGAIPITIALQEPRLPLLYGCDISIDALDVARLNCVRHHVEGRVRLLQGDLVAPLPTPVDMLIANLPYVGTEEMHILARDVREYEPHLALFSGPQGLHLLERFCRNVHESHILRQDGIMLLEIGYQQREPLTRLLTALWSQAEITCIKDYAGWDRIVQMVI